jgi:hypothetical protein
LSGVQEGIRLTANRSPQGDVQQLTIEEDLLMHFSKMVVLSAAVAALMAPAIALPDHKPRHDPPGHSKPPKTKSAPEIDAAAWAPGLAVLGLAFLLFSERSRRRDT